MLLLVDLDSTRQCRPADQFAVTAGAASTCMFWAAIEAAHVSAVAQQVSSAFLSHVYLDSH